MRFPPNCRQQASVCYPPKADITLLRRDPPHLAYPTRAPAFETRVSVYEVRRSLSLRHQRIASQLQKLNAILIVTEEYAG